MASARPTGPVIGILWVSLAIARPAVELGGGGLETVASMRMGRLSLGAEVGWECSTECSAREAAGMEVAAIRDGATAPGKAALVVGEQ